jgi:hypothetical protein
MEIWLVIAALVLLVLVFFEAGRSMIMFVLEHAAGITMSVFGAVWRAHVCIATNLMPRMVVLPTLEKKTTKE